MRSRLTGNIGELVRISHTMKSGKLTAATTNSAMTVVEVHPHASPSTSARVRQKRPTPETSMPGMSRPPSLACGRLRGMTKAQATTAAIPMGMLTKKIHDQWP